MENPKREEVDVNDDDDDEESYTSEELDLLLQVSPIVFYISALEEDGTEDLLDHLVELSTASRAWMIRPARTRHQLDHRLPCEL